jgi:hypothetical protein
MPDRPASKTERRFVRSEDPSLTPEANRLLTEELREVIGKDVVEVPAETPRRADEPHANHSRIIAALIGNRAVVVVSFAAALVVGGIISLSTGEYVAILVAVGLHAIGTMLVTAGAVQLTTEVEHVAPETAARLEQEGVGDPDRVLADLVEDFAGATRAGGTAEVISSGNNDRTVTAEADPAKAMLEQRTAMTPQSVPGAAAGERSAVAVLPWWVVVGGMILSIAAAAFLDQGWVLPVIVVPLGLGWMGLQSWMARSESARSERSTNDVAGAQRRLVPVAAFVVAGAMWFMVVMQWVADFG